jgi:hypothetical protein
MQLTSAQIQKVKSTAPVLAEHGATITRHFYQRMFKHLPELRNVFNQTNQKNGNQAETLARALCAYAAHIDDLGALGPAVADTLPPMRTLVLSWCVSTLAIKTLGRLMSTPCPTRSTRSDTPRTWATSAAMAPVALPVAGSSVMRGVNMRACTLQSASVTSLPTSRV